MKKKLVEILVKSLLVIPVLVLLLVAFVMVMLSYVLYGVARCFHETSNMISNVMTFLVRTGSSFGK